AEYGEEMQFRLIPDFKTATHQIDAICIFPSFIAIVEVKNISGHIHMDGTNRQFFRILNGVMTGMTNPDDQLYRHEKLVRRLIGDKVPIIGIVVFTNSSAILEIKNIKRRVIHLSGLPFVFDELVSRYRTSPTIEIEHYFNSLLSMQPP